MHKRAKKLEKSASPLGLLSEVVPETVEIGLGLLHQH